MAICTRKARSATYRRSEDRESQIERVNDVLDMMQVYLRHCGVEYKKSDSDGRRLQLIEVGPSLDLTIRRHREPSDDLKREATKTVPKTTKKKVRTTVTILPEGDDQSSS